MLRQFSLKVPLSLSFRHCSTLIHTFIHISNFYILFVLQRRGKALIPIRNHNVLTFYQKLSLQDGSCSTNADVKYVKNKLENLKGWNVFKITNSVRN
jgi:hypothetical protein